MMLRGLLRCALAAVALLFGSLSHAADDHANDDQANARINNAINQEYLATRFDEAEAALLGVAEDCPSCSPSVIARAWMYVGIVRGTGKEDLEGARAAFSKAFEADAAVLLDEGLAAPSVKQLFESMRGSAKPGPSEEAEFEVLLPIIDCQPLPLELQTHQPLPILCLAYDGVDSMALHYRVGEQAWMSVDLELDPTLGGYTGIIPCKDTEQPGTLQYYVSGENELNEVVRGLGTARKPVDVRIVERTDEPAPAIPGQVAPERCLAAESVAVTARVSGSWGASCDAHEDCQSDLVCFDGTCESSPSCQGDDDCPAGLACRDQVCTRSGTLSTMELEDFEHWVGLHYAQDIPWMSGQDVCSESSGDSDRYDCFVNGEAYASLLNQYRGGDIASGFAWGSGRFLLSYERQVIDDRPEVSLEGRLGFAFGGGPSGDVTFLPFHLEARGKYWFQERPLDNDLLGTFVSVGLGVASVTASSDIQVEDCDLDEDGEVDTFDNAPFVVPDCRTREQAVLDKGYSGIRTVQAYQRLGALFLEVGGGGMMRLGKNGGLTAHVNLMLMLPRSALVLQPGVGYVMGF